MPAILDHSYPRYLIDLSLAFPTAPAGIQNTNETERPLSALVQVAAYLLKGLKLVGNQARLTPEQLYAELTAGAASCGVSIETVFAMAQSLIMPGSQEAPPDVLQAIDPRLHSSDITARAYQIETAGWSAIRRGSILNFGCGVGKTLTAIMATKTAVKIGQARGTRCCVIAPPNAIHIWVKHKVDLQPYFKDYFVISCDSAHNYTAMDGTEGGCLIIDETHKGGGAVNSGNGRKAARRAIAMHDIRKKFDWCVTLSATLLNTGPEMVLGVQDLALPGLSRVIDLYAYGSHFHAIAYTKVVKGGRVQNLRKLVIPPVEQRPLIAAYLSHGMRSLDFDSPEVISVANVPPQTLHRIDEWPMPEWVAKEKDIVWLGVTPWETYMGALSVAMMYESQEELLEFVQATEPGITDYLAAVQWCLKAEADPFYPGDMKALREQIKRIGLPNFSRLLYATCREGRYDRVIQQVAVENDGVKSLQYRFKYAEGSSRKAPAPGVKIKWVKQWLDDNPDEQLVLGAGGHGTVAILAKMLTDADITFGVIEGGVATKIRGQIEADFQAGTCRVMLGQEVAASESLTLISAATSVLVDHDWKPIPYTQWLGRTRRIGQVRETHHYDLVMGHPQILALRRVRDGREFDNDTRKELERLVRGAMPLAT